MYCLCRVQFEQKDDHVTEKSMANIDRFLPLNLLSIVNRSKMLS